MARGDDGSPPLQKNLLGSSLGDSTRVLDEDEEET
jgi:hypothetical protein